MDPADRALSNGSKTYGTYKYSFGRNSLSIEKPKNFYLKLQLGILKEAVVSGS